MPPLPCLPYFLNLEQHFTNFTTILMFTMVSNAKRSNDSGLRLLKDMRRSQQQFRKRQSFGVVGPRV